MYCFSITLAVLLFFLLIGYGIRKYLVQKVSDMTFFDKSMKLHNALEPCGFLYNYPEDILTSAPDAWHRKFGYTTSYNEKAPFFQMVFDCEPVYFDYAGRTWLIALWKGQYGIKTGGEVGIWRAEEIIPESGREKAFFSSVPDAMLPKTIFRIYRDKKPLFTSCGRHCRLTGFRMGTFSMPSQLHMPVCITFPNDDMLQAFSDSLLTMGYALSDLSTWQHSLSFCFTVPKSEQPSLANPWRLAWIQKKNRALCGFYRMLTRPFDTALDQLTFLSYCLPILCRKIIAMNHIGKCRGQGREEPGNEH